MGRHLDPELLEVLPDPDLLDLARLLSSQPAGAAAEVVPLDQNFRWALRRRLLNAARQPAEPAVSWWRRLQGPPVLAWAGATVGALLIAAVVVLNVVPPPGGGTGVRVSSPLADAQKVPLVQPIPVQFSQPMDHPSTEAAVQLQPATKVTYQWQGNTLLVQPQSRQLAPNTQYQVTVGPGAKSLSGQTVAEPQTITFVTQPAPSPRPSPSPVPTPTSASTSLIKGERLLAAQGEGRAFAFWSPDETSVFYRGKDGQLAVVPAGSGPARVLVPDGVEGASVSPDGTRVAFVRAGRLQELTVRDGKLTDVAAGARVFGWRAGTLLWDAGGGAIMALGTAGASRVASIPADAVTIAFAPGGERLVYQQGNSLFLFDVASAKSAGIGGTGSALFGWSPDGKRVVADTTIFDTNGKAVGTIASLPDGTTPRSLSWGPDQILVSGSKALYAVRPDGSGPRKLADGDYQVPQLSPSGASLIFFRTGSVWAGDLAEPVPPGAVPDAAYKLVDGFLGARIAGRADDAQAYLDQTGREAFTAGGLNLVITGDPHLARYFVVLAQAVGTPAAYRFTLRMVLVHEKTEVSQFDEMLTVQRDSNGRLYVHQAAAAPRRPTLKGPELISASFAGGRLQLGFDSDLDPSTTAAGVAVHDLAGHTVPVQVDHADRTLTLTASALKPGTSYLVSVLAGLKDVAGRPPVSQYDLGFVAPDDLGSPSSSPSPSPPPAASPSPRPSSTPAASPSPGA